MHLESDTVAEAVAEVLTMPRVLDQRASDRVDVAPGGARPSYAQGYYARDNAFYVAWDAISRDRGRFQAWIETHVLSAEGVRP